MIINSQVDKIDSKIQYVTDRIKRLEEEQKELKELEKELEELQITREEAVKDKKTQEVSFGMNLLGAFIGVAVGACIAYESLPKEKQEELDKQIARNMFNKAVQGKLTEPYTDYEVEFMMEHLK